ncbi:MAG: efflux RND transporter permease subunit, partial [Leptospiraceae bacterium]|nr:efflux RND transporter permease subunit [Leptospiraceae bacterium]
QYFLDRTLLVNILLSAVFFSAYAIASNMNRDQFPEADMAKMIIITKYPGASPKDVEQNVTRLIEDELKGISGLDRFKSVSAENVSRVIVDIDINQKNQEEIKDEVRRAVSRVTNLPSEVDSAPEVRDLKSSEFPIITLGISGDVPYGELRGMAKSIESDLKRISGVAKIDKYAYRDLEYKVQLYPDKLKEYYVALNDVLFAINKRNIRATGGNLESYRTQRNILTLSQFETTKDVEEVIVRSEFAGGRVLVKDLGNVEEGYEDEKMRTIFDGKKGITLVIKKSSTSDIIRLNDKINEYVEQKRKTIGSGVNLKLVNDASSIVRNRIDVVISNAIIGFILVIIILIIFLDFTSSFLIALSIPTSFALTFILMPFGDVEINSISLAAMIIALGMIVDQAIVISENALHEIKKGKPKLQAIKDGTLEVVMPVSASVLTTVLSFAPMFVMSGIMGKFIVPIPVVVIASLCGSLLVSFFILPNHLSHALRERRKEDLAEEENKVTWQDRFFSIISIPYEKAMLHILHHRYIAIIVAIFLLLFSLFWAKNNVVVNLFPPDGADTFFIFLELEDDSTFNATEEVVSQIEKLIQEIPKEEINYYTAKLGTKDSNELAKPNGGEEHLAVIQITLVPVSKRKRSAVEIMEALREKTLSTVKGAKEINFELKKIGPPAGKPIEIHVHSDNDGDRKIFVNRIIEELKKIDGVYDITSNSKLGREEYKLDIDYNVLATVGLTVQDVASTLRIAFDGVKATSIVKNNEEVTINVRFPLEHRENVKNVLELDVRNFQGKLIPLKAFASLSKTRAETAIHHTDGDVTTTVTAQAKIQVQPKKAIDKVLSIVSTEIKEYPNVNFSYGGEAEKTQESVGSLLFAFVGGIIAIYMVLIILFNSLTQPMIVLFAIPFGIIGVIWAFYFHGRPFSFMGLIGAVGLSGIVVNNSLMMVEFINKLVQDKTSGEKLPTSKELIPEVVAGSARRLRPIIITMTTTVTGLLPTAYGVGGSDPFIEPMVIAIAWGLLLSTQISLILIPCFYLANMDGYLFIKKNYLVLKNLIQQKISERNKLDEKE